MTADSWCRTIGPLATCFDVIAPDLLDNGFTGAGPYTGGPPHAAILDHLEQLIDRLSLRDIHLIGSSFGAALSILLYHRRPDIFATLVLVSSGSTFKSAEQLVAMYERAAKNGGAALANPSLEVCRSRLSNLFYDPARIPDELLLMQLTPYALPTALPAFEKRMRGMMDVEAMRPFAIRDKLKDIRVPVLGIWGKQDPRGDYEEAVTVLSALPNIRIEVIDRCGHLPHLEQSERFNAILQDFLNVERPSSH
jgi:2-hydroxy-6-oxonona-2,4-dienedioate hydrolase